MDEPIESTTSPPDPPGSAPDARVRVVFVIDHYPPSVAGGGAPQAVRSVLARGVLDAVVVTTDTDLGSGEPHPPDARLESEHGAPVDYVDGPARRPVRFWRRIRDRHRPAVVVCMSPFSRRTVALLVGRWLTGAALRSAGPHIVIWSQGELLPVPLAGKTRRKTLFLRVGRAAGLFRGVRWFVVHPDERAATRRLLGVDPRVHPVPAPRPLGPPRPLAKRAGRLDLVFAGRLVERKGVHVVLEAMARVDGTVHLDVIGPEEDPVYAARCRELAARLGDDRVVFTGGRPHTEVLDAFSTHHASVLASAEESYGYTVAESMGAGCVPIITPQVPFDLDDDQGVIVERTVAGIASGLERLVALDGDEFERMRRAAHRAAVAAADEDVHATSLGCSLAELVAGTASTDRRTDATT